MTSPAAHAHPHYRINRSAVAVGAAVVAAVLTAIGQFKGDSTFSSDWGAWLIELAAIAIATGLVFWLIVPNSLRGGDAGKATRNAVILGAVGFLSLIVFWLGLPAVLAGGAAYLAANADATTGRPRALAIAAYAVAGITVVLAIIIAFIG